MYNIYTYVDWSTWFKELGLRVNEGCKSCTSMKVLGLGRINSLCMLDTYIADIFRIETLSKSFGKSNLDGFQLSIHHLWRIFSVVFIVH